ncbi:TetR/AcrR family transcriptional regulator [Tsukamurella pseudospumae]|uniref:TetR family transcriptional regulator n=1 Tax=Tsukamurella pseudospumae TaxID=239498 RepID=A0A138A7S8_9ACTN|nr:TetR/AcrR family transcriptional regulator [Tsukamurella pseudospumae]KXP06514.1 TetR family transcriptional regulator [Tsukamurella pseudospumae]
MARIPAAERRQELIDAAVLVIAESGVDGATTRRIADRAGAPLATLHYCFASKELLFGAVFEHIAGRYREVLIASDVHGDVATTTRGLMRGLLQWYVDNPETASAIVELISWARRQDGAKATGVYDEALDTVRSILVADAAAAGQSIDDETLERLAYVVTVIADGFAINWLMYRQAGLDPEIDLTLGLLDAWMAANLSGGGSVDPVGVQPARPRPGAAESPEKLADLVSWVDVG